MSSRNRLYPLMVSAILLALALVLPFLTGQLRQFGNALCPMHFPVLLCGFFCGPWYAGIIGLIAPFLRFLLFGMPPIMPTGAAMSLELAAYGLAAGFLYRRLASKRGGIYLSLLPAMLFGRVVWGGASVVLYGLGSSSFGWAAFLSGAFLRAIPGILVQVIAIPAIVSAAKKLPANRR